MFKFSLRLAVVFGLVITAIPSWEAGAQNPTCPTRPLGDNSNACASTAFVQTAVGTAIPAGTTTNTFAYWTGTTLGWTTATYPITATGTGTFLRANGTNWLASTLTIPNTAVAGSMLYASTSNVLSASITPILGVAGSALGTLGLSGNSAGVITLAPAANTTSYTFTFPDTAGSSGQVLQTNGSGTTSWSSAGAIGGSTGSVDKSAIRANGTGGATIQASSLIIADTTGALSRSGAGGIPVQGTNTNNNAAAGDIGEVVSSSVTSGSAIALTTNVQVNITSVSLTAGDWDCRAAGYMTGTGTTNVTRFNASISSTTNTSSTTVGTFSTYILPAGGTVFNHDTPSAVLPSNRVSIGSTETRYLVALATFTVSTAGAFGTILCRRVR